MFTGIIEEIGIVQKIESKKNFSILEIKADKILRGTKPGDSICVNGVCLTVTSSKAKNLRFDIMKESLNATTLAGLKTKSHVNLERALKADSRLGGHFVTGHVDCVGEIVQKISEPNYIQLTIKIPTSFMPFIVAKGSITLNGVSLTVGEVKANHFSVYLIPFTESQTNFKDCKKGDTLNIETDILAKYILNRKDT